jgi:CO/xanthine dehydrogenase Mo-binding subunit
MAARDPHGPNPPWEQGFSVVGKPNRKVDGLAKATGEALYTDDLALPGMLHAKTLRSPVAHAKLLRIDATRALALPGVHAVITGHDLPERYGVIPWTQDETALAVDKVRFVGDPVAAVAAIDEETANRALDLIDVEYEPLHAFIEPEDALAHPEPRIHEDRKNNVSKHVLLDTPQLSQLRAARPASSTPTLPWGMPLALRMRAAPPTTPLLFYLCARSASITQR